MKALVWHGKNDVRVERVPAPTMQTGDILGYEFMGDVVEVGQQITSARRSRRRAIYHRVRQLKADGCVKVVLKPHPDTVH